MANRPKQGHRYSSGRGGIDIGEILLAGLTGVEANPEFGMEGAKTSGEFYKPKSFLDRRSAREANADFKAQEYTAEQDVARKLKLEQALSPILKGRTLDTNDLQVQMQKQLSPIKIDEARALAVIQALQQAGVLPTQANEASYDKSVSPLAIEAAGQGYMEKSANSQASALKAMLERAKTLGTSEDQIGQAVAESKFGRTLAESKMADPNLIQNLIQNQNRMLQAQPRALESSMVNDRLRTMSPGSSIVDPISSKTLYSAPFAPPSPEDAAKAQLLQNALSKMAGGAGTNNTSVNAPPVTVPQPIRPENKYVDPETGKIYYKSR